MTLPQEDEGADKDFHLKAVANYEGIKPTGGINIAESPKDFFSNLLAVCVNIN